MSVREAVHTVLGDAKSPLTVDEIYKQIESRKLFTFNTPEPRTIVRQALRRHCVDLEFPQRAR